MSEATLYRESSRTRTHNCSYMYRGTPLIRNYPPLGPYRRPVPGVLGGSWGGGRLIVGEETL